MKNLQRSLQCGMGMLFLLFSVVVQAQFTPALTPEQFIVLPGGAGGVTGVQNTDAFLNNGGGLEYGGIVWDGPNPSFSVVFGLTGTSLPGNLAVSLAGNSLGTITDPSVIVVPFLNDGLALVTYVLTPAGGVPAIFSEVYSLTATTGITLLLPPTQISNPGAPACYSPNMDVNTNGQYVITWVEGDLVMARSGTLSPALLNISPNIFDVTLNTTPLTISNLIGFNSSVDVAINDAGRVNFAYTDGFNATGVTSSTLFLTSTDFVSVGTLPGAASGATVVLPLAAGQGIMAYYSPKIYMNPGNAIVHITGVANNITTGLSTVLAWTVNTFVVPVITLPTPSVVISAVPGGGSVTQGIGFGNESAPIAGAGGAAAGCFSVGWSFLGGLSVPTIPGSIINSAYTAAGRSFAGNFATPLPVGTTSLNLFRTLPTGGFTAQADFNLSLSGKFSASGRFLAAWFDGLNGQILYKVVACGAATYRTATEDGALETADGADQDIEGTRFVVYPNPFTDQLTVEFNLAEGDQGQSIEIFSLTGQMVWSESISQATTGNNRVELQQMSDRGELPAGMYLMKITTDQKTETRKIQKTN